MPEIIESAKNPFGGVVTKADSLTGDPAAFRGQLDNSLELWRSQGVLVVWLEIPIRSEGVRVGKECDLRGLPML